MFLRTTSRKNVDGATITYLQLAESTWNKRTKRSEMKIIHNFGRADSPKLTETLRRLTQSIIRRCSPEELVEDKTDWRLIDAWPYGDMYVLEALWKRLELDKLIARLSEGRKYEFSLERALFAMITNRCIAPCSKLYCHEQWLRKDVWMEGSEELEVQHLYRAMDFLIEHKEEIEKSLFFQLGDLLNLDVEIVFYDTTSLHFEIDHEDAEIESGNRGEGEAEIEDLLEETELGSESPPLRKRGYAKNKRSDLPQIVIGLAVTRDGFPIKHWIFPGNTVDVTTVEQVKEDLKGWRLTRCVFVADAGMVSQENLRVLGMGGGKYIACMPVKRSSDISKEVLERKGRYQYVVENLRVKEVIVDEGERRRRYVVCHNPLEQERQRKHREQVVLELEAELSSLEVSEGDHSRRVCKLLSSRRYSRYIRKTKTGKLRISKAKIREYEKLDGKFVVHSNDDSLSAQDLALGYKQLMRVEECWRTLKSGLQMRPVYHSLEHRIRAHVMLSVLALLLERMAERACSDTWRNIRDDLKQIKVAQLLGPEGELWQITEPRSGALNRLKLLEIKNPPTILKYS